MQDILFWLATINLTLVVVISAYLVIGGRTVEYLRDFPADADGSLPTVSLIVAARNEERNIEAAMRSLLKLNYPDLEITIVNDRSTDRTGEILDALAREQPRLNVVHLKELPRGWLGKNHALQFGADRSHGEWLLFTDADVVFEPTLLRRAMPLAVSRQIDHLTLLPETKMPTWLLQSFVVTFALFFSILMRPWKVRDPKSSAHIGVGAFNLLRAAAYRSMGGHQPLAMRPDDDIKLGKLVKQCGFRQEVLNGIGLLEVPWYGSVRELLVGLEKNTFAVLEYSVLATLASVAAILLFDVWPFLAPLFTDGVTRWMYVATALLLWLMAWAAAIGIKAPWSCALGFPLGAFMFAVIQLRSMFLTLKNGGIRWRDTHYPLAELKANRL